MDAIFLSASVPQPGRGDFYKTASPLLIQCAVRELLICALGRRLIVWGGHPAITPMVWAACEDLGVSYADSVVLYQSRFFETHFPEENTRFKNVIYVDAVTNDLKASLHKLRLEMFSRTDLRAAVFIGGMDGIVDEYQMFRVPHPDALIVALPGPGGAAQSLAQQRGEWNSNMPEDLDFASLFYSALKISPNERRGLPLVNHNKG